MEILNVKNLGFTYAGAASKALNDVSFTVEKGDLVLMLGSTGSGKSTLLRLLKREVAPQGTFEGRIYFDGKDFSEMTDHESATRIGFVCQQPEQQIVCDKVWHELAFGLENLGCPSAEIRKRVSEMAAYFGIEEWFMRSTAELSGGEKQLLNLASVMVMQPDIILLDEPTAQL
ncbi:MAG: ABC transporter ATP-binding protein, partial [Lachnospiraceae bacterium]|nr:ABC transporter ATP-binding protein [Lachnospiraceae bacterium]